MFANTANMVRALANMAELAAFIGGEEMMSTTESGDNATREFSSLPTERVDPELVEGSDAQMAGLARTLGVTEKQARFIVAFVRHGKINPACREAGIARSTAQEFLGRTHVLKALIQHTDGALLELWLTGLRVASEILEDSTAPAAARVTLLRHLDDRVNGRAPEAAAALPENPLQVQRSLISKLQALRSHLAGAGEQ